MNNNPAQAPTMKWHKFLIYFSLWANAVLALGQAAQMLTGSQYGSQDVIDALYARFQNLKGADMAFGILNIALAAYLIYTRFQLASFKKGAPGKLTLAYGMALVLTVAYPAVLSGITKLSFQEVSSDSVIGLIAADVVMMIVNHIYYQKRAFMFEGASGQTTGGTGTVSGGAGTAANPGFKTVNPPPRDRFCTHCGQKAEPGDQWCTRCGTKLD